MCFILQQEWMAYLPVLVFPLFLLLNAQISKVENPKDVRSVSEKTGLKHVCLFHLIRTWAVVFITALLLRNRLVTLVDEGQYFCSS
jgi:hypothetical protein